MIFSKVGETPQKTAQNKAKVGENAPKAAL